MKDLAGKTAFVTGAASGIGLGIATAFAQAGVKVMLCDIEEGALAKAVEGLKRTNADVDGVRADVSIKTELKAGRRDHGPLYLVELRRIEPGEDRIRQGAVAQSRLAPLPPTRPVADH
jgi:NAD(P)-dependent dehydrogenase (short-subunit alcohol dehydrogenase family)